MNTTEAAYRDIGLLSDGRSVVCLSVWHDHEPCENGWTDRGTVWAQGSPKESCMRWGRDTFTEMVKFDGVRHIGMHWTA